MGFLVWFCVEAAAFGQSAPEALSDLLVRRARMFAAIPLATSSDLELAHQLGYFWLPILELSFGGGF